jgi:hypothetical protein
VEKNASNEKTAIRAARPNPSQFGAATSAAAYLKK